MKYVSLILKPLTNAGYADCGLVCNNLSIFASLTLIKLPAKVS